MSRPETEVRVSRAFVHALTSHEVNEIDESEGERVGVGRDIADNGY